MNHHIETRHDQKRGCGYRKAGGLYLVTGGEAAPCFKLPIPLTVCPTCHGGIHPSRGFTWVDADKLAGGRECLPPPRQRLPECERCPLAQGLGMAGLLWIGESFYKQPEDWSKEAMMQGISRRIHQIPTKFKIGETWVLVAHRKVRFRCEACAGTGKINTDLMVESEAGQVLDKRACKACEGGGFVRKRGIFSIFRPSAIEYVVKGDEPEEKLERLAKRGVTLVKVVTDQTPLLGDGETQVEEDHTDGEVQ
jgi:hypothetical protein